MKRFATILIIFVILTSCKNDPKSQVEPSVDETEAKDDGLTLLKGEFLYLADAAVLQTQREIYGVVIDEKMHELDDMVKPYKKKDTDMVPVVVRAKITQKPENEEGWEYRIHIKEIIGVTEPSDDDSNVIKIGN